MTTREEIVQILRENREHLASEYGVEKIALFGSAASGKSTDDSDIDLVVEFSRPVGFLFMELAEYLEALLGKKVDLLTPAGIDGIRVSGVAETIRENLVYV